MFGYTITMDNNCSFQGFVFAQEKVWMTSERDNGLSVLQFEKKLMDRSLPS